MTPTPFILKLRNGSELSAQDEQALGRVVDGVRRLRANADIVLEHQRLRSLIVVLDGWACRYKNLANGKRQIISFFLPGDLCEPYGMLPTSMDHSFGSLTPISFTTIAPPQIREIARSHPRVEEALWWDVLSAMAMMHERVVSLGRRSAVERMGHLFCELQLRLEMVGLADETGFDLPITQGDIADALGLSAVHVNRSLQDLRAAKLIRLQGRRLTILNREELKVVSFFDPSFLHVRPPNGRD